VNTNRVRVPSNRSTRPHNRAVCPLAVLLAICCCVSSSAASALQPSFDPKDVVRQVRTAHSGPSAEGRELSALDDGEFLVDTSVTLVPSQCDQYSPALAFDGANFLVVWEDDRSGNGWDIYGARVTPQGTILDSVGIAISTAPYRQESPALAFDGANFIVVWQDYRGGWDIYGARVTPQGTVLDTAGIAISLAAGDQLWPAVGFDGTNLLVVWGDQRGGSNWDIYAARVTRGGVVLDTAGIAVSQAADDQCGPDVGFDGSNLLVVWDDYRNDTYSPDIYGARVTSGGAVLDSAGIAIATGYRSQREPALAFDGANFLVAWQEPGNGLSDICGARVTPQGMVLDPSGFAISRAANGQYGPAVGFDGATFLVAWKDYRSGVHNPSDVYGARVTPQGEVLDSAGIVISQAANDQYNPAVGIDGANFLVAWQDNRSGSDYDIYGARVTPQGTVFDSAGFAISKAVKANDQRLPAVGFDGANFLVAWEDDRSGSGWDIYGARAMPQGTVLDSVGFAISQAANNQRLPAVGFDGVNLLVAWEDDRSGSGWDIYSARVTPQGEVLDSTGIAISLAAGDQFSPAVGFDGVNFLVAWEDDRSGSGWDIYGARVTPQGMVLDPSGFAISQAANDQNSPVVGFDGTNCLVAWTDSRSGFPGGICGARVTPEGVVLDSAGIVISQEGSYDQGSPAVGFDGANFLVVWQDGRSGWFDIYGARVTPQGAVLDSTGIPIAPAAYRQSSPAVGFDGANFLVAWQDNRSGGDYDIYGARVTPGGAVFEGGSVVSQQGNQLSPRLCCGNGGRMLLAYQGWAGTVGGRTYNTDRVWGKIDPNPGVTEAPNAKVRTAKPLPTIIRGVLCLPLASSVEREASSVLLDVSGRKVMDVRPGANDVRALAPGVYFVREEPQATSLKPQAVRKVIITR